MLKSLHLEGFKSFRLPVEVKLAPITVLAGRNNVGKSCVTAALGMLIQTEEQGASIGPGLLVSGPWARAGRAIDVPNRLRRDPEEARRFIIGLTSEFALEARRITASFELVYDCEDTPDNRYRALLHSAQVATEDDADEGIVLSLVRKGGAPLGIYQVQVDEVDIGEVSLAGLGHISTFSGGGAPAHIATALVSPLLMRPSLFTPATALVDLWSEVSPRRNHILTAHRSAPNELYLPRPGQGPMLGLSGEHVAQALFDGQSRTTDLHAPQRGLGEEVRVLQAVNDWWSHIFADSSLRASASEVGRIGYGLTVSTGSAEDLFLYQVGLGLSQTLPIIIMMLQTQRGDRAIVETPEAHLHPAAQYRLTDLFIAAAAQGRQIIIETHSDHVINRLRLAVKQGLLAAGDLKIYFASEKDASCALEEVTLDRNGRISHWPEGFFDQASLELIDLLEPAR